jgi:hypothetical protein
MVKAVEHYKKIAIQYAMFVLNLNAIGSADYGLKRKPENLVNCFFEYQVPLRTIFY